MIKVVSQSTNFEEPPIGIIRETCSGLDSMVDLEQIKKITIDFLL